MYAATRIKNRQRVCRTLVAALLMSAGAGAASAQDQPTISMAINQSPWLDSFVAMVDQYEEETGNRVELDVTPFGGLLEKIRNSVRASQGSYDIVNVNSLWLSEIYSGGFLAPLGEIEANYQLPEGVLSYGNTTNWDASAATFSSDGALMGVPVNGNVQVLYYNTEIYEQFGLKPPKTWDDLFANAKAIQEGGEYYGFVPRAARDSIVYNFTPYLFSHDAAFFRITGPDQAEVTLNSPEGLKALETYVKIATEAGPPGPGNIAQGELIQLMATGKGAQAIAVIAAWGQLEDPNASRVVGKINAALLPAGPDGMIASSAGHWVAGIPKNVAPEKQKAALAFLDWFAQKERQVDYVRAGGVPVRGDITGADLGDEAAFRFIEAYSQNARHAVMGLPFASAAEASDAMALSFNRAVIGELTQVQALNQAAADLAGVLERAGFTVSKLPDL
ncbi:MULTISPECIES: ABC transporter substrate-binding protein [Chelativorans]|uniref:ABC transporter substrate-binding protein n=1 Tax=Chelativorans intermedius TaxID=515947 RepID=A0ABV6DCQ2_9HYPH|nr:MULTISPECIES: extracellular solute-binding protein [Chelativorans]MCT9000652.1 extracellular solute-binding protein [Chelativorans intermedius]WEX12175.1 extracellular solute-binding protein [Chelativorans sp. AA-79]